MIKHNRSRDKSFSAERAGVRTLSCMITAMHGERRRLCERFAAHGTEIRPLAGVDALMHHVILAMREALTAHVADQRSRPVNRLMCGQRLGARKLLGARIAGIRRHGLGGDYRTTVPTTAAATTTGDNTEIAGYHRIDGRRHRVGTRDYPIVVTRRQRSVGFRVMIVQVARLETHQASRAGVGLLLTDLLMHPPMTFQ